MRTTIRLSDHLTHEVKQAAAKTGQTFTAFVEDALRDALKRRQSKARSPRIKLPVFKGKGLQPGVDLDNSAALLDIMGDPEKWHAPR
jgi:hypothetical protein